MVRFSHSVALGGVDSLQRFGWDKVSDAFVFRMNENVPVHVSWPFAVPAVLPFLGEWSTRPGTALTHTVILAALLFLSVLLHELAHVWAARRRGIGTERIDLYLLGGIAWFKPGKTSLYGWAWIAFAGPLANIILALVFVAAYHLVARPLPVETDGFFNSPPPRSDTILEWALWLGALVNTALAILNLLPAFPLDGGAIAKRLLTPRFGAGNAARIVGFCGVVLSTLRFVVMLAAAIAGTMVWIPPLFKPNWRAFRGPSRKKVPSQFPAADPASEVEWRGKGGWPVKK